MKHRRAILRMARQVALFLLLGAIVGVAAVDTAIQPWAPRRGHDHDARHVRHPRRIDRLAELPAQRAAHLDPSPLELEGETPLRSPPMKGPTRTKPSAIVGVSPPVPHRLAVVWPGAALSPHRGQYAAQLPASMSRSAGEAASRATSRRGRRSSHQD